MYLPSTVYVLCRPRGWGNEYHCKSGLPPKETLQAIGQYPSYYSKETLQFSFSSLITKETPYRSMFSISQRKFCSSICPSNISGLGHLNIRFSGKPIKTQLTNKA